MSRPSDPKAPAMWRERFERSLSSGPDRCAVLFGENALHLHSALASGDDHHPAPRGGRRYSKSARPTRPPSCDHDADLRQTPDRGIGGRVTRRADLKSRNSTGRCHAEYRRSGPLRVTYGVGGNVVTVSGPVTASTNSTWSRRSTASVPSRSKDQHASGNSPSTKQV